MDEIGYDIAEKILLNNTFSTRGARNAQVLYKGFNKQTRGDGQDLRAHTFRESPQSKAVSPILLNSHMLHPQGQLMIWHEYK